MYLQANQRHLRRSLRNIRPASIRFSIGPFHTSPFLRDEEQLATAPQKPDKALLKQNARDFNNRRAAYNRQVTALRSEYAAQIAATRAAEAAAEKEKRERLTRRRLERQRRKNERSAANALRQEQFRLDQAAAHQAHLEHQHNIRTAKEDRLKAARQLVINELEIEAPLWLTTPEEVEAAFADTAKTQALWGRPQGVLGAPNPSLDAHFWKYETHTADMSRTYRTRRQVLLEKTLEIVYEEANVDTTNFWTPERTALQERRERRARLRAMVQAAGQKALLDRQRQMMAEVREGEDIVAAQKLTAPSTKVLADAKALEQEGAKLLLERPQDFFHFESSSGEGDATLGTPVALKDHLRDSSGGHVFPVIIGKEDKDEMQGKTNKEKKQAQRQERFMAAAKSQDQKKQAEEKEPEVLDDDFEQEFADADYEAAERDADDDEWEKGLNPVTDELLLKIPRDKRYTPEEIEWVIEQMEHKLDHHTEQLKQDISVLQVDLSGGLGAEVPKAEDGEPEDAEAALEAALATMPEDQLLKLSDLDDVYSPDMPATELEEGISGITSLSRDQILMVLGRDRTTTEATALD